MNKFNLQRVLNYLKVRKKIKEKRKDKYILCDNHEYRRRAFVCQHLSPAKKVGFVEAFETFENMEISEDDDFQAWCAECEAIRHEEGEWNDMCEKFAQIKMVCDKCYFEMKEFNLGLK